MSDDDPSVYKPASGDLDKSGKLKKTKPSKHTLKFKKMFGDDVNELAMHLHWNECFCNDKVHQTYVSKVNNIHWSSNVSNETENNLSLRR